MRNISEKFAPHILDFFFLLNVFLKLVVRPFQFGDRLFQLPRHRIEAFSQHADLIIAAPGVFGVKI